MRSPHVLLESNLPSFVDLRPVSKKALGASAAFVVVLYCALWSPHWYPLSDSALYLSLGKSLANGQGFQFLGETNRLAAPLTPILLAIALRLGGDIGTFHVLMIGFMLLGLALAYSTLKHWVGERAALAATLATSISFWVIQCTTTVMTEPLCLTLFWGLLYCLTVAAQTESRIRRTLWLMTALLLFFASFENRAAMILLLPGLLLAYWLMAARVASRIERLTWITCFCLVLGSAFWDYRQSGHVVRFVSHISAALLEKPVSIATVPKPEKTSAPEDSLSVVSTSTIEVSKENKISTAPKAYAKHNSRYRFELPHVKSIAKYPYYFGRWICEGLMAPTVAFFQTSNLWLHAVGCFISLTALSLTILGLWLMCAQRQWWVLGFISYCLPIWLIWASRIIPRYMVPFAPIVFLLLWYAISWIALKVHQKFALEARRGMTWGGVGLVGLLSLLVIGNFPPLAIEVYLRRNPNRNFYEVARRGATKELLQIGSYIRTHSEDGDVVGCNAKFFHRVVHFVTEMPVKNIPEKRPDVQKVMREMNCRYVIVFSTDDAPWPKWHLPWPSEASNQSWWRLYERASDGNYTYVNPSQITPGIQVAGSNLNLVR